MRQVMFLLILLVAFSAQGAFYQIDVVFDPVQATLTGSQALTFTNETGVVLEALEFNLLANQGAKPNPHISRLANDQGYPRGFDPTWTRIGRVAIGGVEAEWELVDASPVMTTYSLEEGVLRVTLPEPLGVGETVEVEIDFVTKFAHSHAGDNAHLGETFTWRFGWFPQLRTWTGDGWDTGFRLSPLEYVVNLRVPERFVVASGADNQVEEVKQGWKQVELSSAGPRFSIPLTLSPHFRTLRQRVGEIEVVQYYLPGHEHEARVIMSYVPEILETFQEAWGPYRYDRLVIAENRNPGAGMAADGFVLITEVYYVQANLLAPGISDRIKAFLLAHEIGHLWWGIGVGADMGTENWLSESFAQYAGYRFFEDTYGSKGANLMSPESTEVLINQLNSLMREPNFREMISEIPYLTMVRDGWDEAIVKPMGEMRDLNTYSTRVYEKGYLLLRATEWLLGREEMDRVLAQVFQEYQGKHLTTGEFLALVQDLTGEPLGELLAPWLFEEESLDFDLVARRGRQTKDGYLTVLEIHREGPYFPVEVLALTRSGKEIRVTYTDPRAKGELELLTSEPIVRFHLDPDHMLPDTDRFNNHLPRKYRFTTGNPFDLDTYWLRYRLDPHFLLEVGEESAVLNELGMEMGVSGWLRDEHIWDLGALLSYDLLDKEWSLQPRLLGQLNLSRSNLVFGELGYSNTAGWTGQLGGVYRHWMPVHVGYAAPIWYPVYQAQGALRRSYNGESDSAYHALDLLLLQDASIRSNALRQVNLTILTNGSGRVGLGSQRQFRLLSWLTGEWSGAVGSSFGELVGPERLAMAVPGFDPVSASRTGEASLGLVAPVLQYQEVKVYNLVSFRDLGLGLRLNAGTGFDAWEEAIDETRLSLGTELHLGLGLPTGGVIRLGVGYAHPLYAREYRDGEGSGRIYVTVRGIGM